MAVKQQETEEIKTAEAPKKESKSTVKEAKKTKKIGPTVISYGLNKNTVYEELTAGVKDLIEKEIKRIGMSHVELFKQEYIDAMLDRYKYKNLEDIFLTSHKLNSL